MSSSSGVVVAGHICLDIIPKFGHRVALTPGCLFEVGAPTLATGGAVSNTGIALHILGMPTTLVGKVGDDAFGLIILDILRRYAPTLDRGMVVAAGEVSSYSVVINIPGQDRTFLHCPGANHSFGASDVALPAYASASLFHFGYPTLMGRMYAGQGEELVDIFRRVKAAGVTTSLDMTMPDPGGPSGQAPWAAILTATLPLVDVFLPSADELLYMLDRDLFGHGDRLNGDQVSRLGARLIDMGVAIAGLKLGSRGLYVRTAGRARLQAMGRGCPGDLGAWANRELWFPVYEIPQFVGATGAGDTTIAGFLAGLLRGRGIERCGCFANAVGSCNVQVPDALSGIKSWAETEQLLEAGWRQDPLEVQGRGWGRNPATGLWHGPGDAVGGSGGNHGI